MYEQKTIADKIKCHGVGLHTGETIELELLPAETGTGIVFSRTDLPQIVDIPALSHYVVDTNLATTLGRQSHGITASISTTEHLLAALRGLGIDNLRVLVNGPEIPVFDGSAKHFTELLLSAGITAQNKAKEYIVVKKEVCVRDGESYARVLPDNRAHLTCSVDFEHPLINPQPFSFDLAKGNFARDLAPARTFGFLRDVQKLASMGLAKGGSLRNAIIIDGYRILNPEGLRFSDEFARHKTLDALGDLALLGRPVMGHVHMHRSGHTLNLKLMQAILADASAYDIISAAQPEAATIEQLGLLGAIQSLA